MSPVPGAWPHALVDPSTNFKDLLSHGVVVSVNGQPWNRIVAHVSDPEEETETGEEPEIEGSEWEDDPAGAGTETGNEEMMTPGGEGVTKRRPRKARFGSAAGNAVKGDDKGSVRRKRRPSEVKDRMREDRDRAVVVVYGLSPGKEYEIELQVVGLSAPDAGDPFGKFRLQYTSPDPEADFQSCRIASSSLHRLHLSVKAILAHAQTLSDLVLALDPVPTRSPVTGPIPLRPLTRRTFRSAHHQAESLRQSMEAMVTSLLPYLPIS